MERAEGTFSLDRFDDEPPYDDQDGVKLARAHITGTRDLTGIRGEGEITIGRDGGHSYTLDYEL